MPGAPAPPRGRVCCLLRALAWQVGRKRAVLVKSRARFVPSKSNPVPQLSRPRHQPRHQAEKETSAAEMLQKKKIQGHSRSESSPALRPLHLSELAARAPLFGAGQPGEAALPSERHETFGFCSPEVALSSYLLQNKERGGGRGGKEKRKSHRAHLSGRKTGRKIRCTGPGQSPLHASGASKTLPGRGGKAKASAA